MKAHTSKFKENYRFWLPVPRPAYRQTDCFTGYSMWHLAAIGLIEDHVIHDFLRTANNQASGVLIDDLRESTWRPLEVMYRGWIGELHDVPIDEFNLYFLHRSVADLCCMTSVPLLGYWDLEDESIHPVIKAFNSSLDFTVRISSRI